MRKRVGIIGSNASIATEKQCEFAHKLGKLLVDNEFDIINGGMGGIMEASAKGATESNNYDRASVIGFLPVIRYDLGNKFSGIQIISDIGSARNRFIILNSIALIAIGGGAGTLNEISLAWELGKPIAAYNNGGGWASKLAGQKIDDRRKDEIYSVIQPMEVIDWLKGLK